MMATTDRDRENHSEMRKRAFALKLAQAIEEVRADFADEYFTRAIHDAIVVLSGDDESDIDIITLSDMIGQLAEDIAACTAAPNGSGRETLRESSQ